MIPFPVVDLFLNENSAVAAHCLSLFCLSTGTLGLPSYTATGPEIEMSAACRDCNCSQHIHCSSDAFLAYAAKLK